MDAEQFPERLKLILKQYYLPIILGGVGIVFLLYGLISSVIHKQEKGNILFQAASDTADSSTAKASGVRQITIDIEGAVIKPGVYKLPEDARVQDVLIAAGGMSENADREKVSKNLNLASKISDGGKIYIPFVGDSSSVSQSGASNQSVMGDSVSGMVNINTASATELDTLSGVGPATAEKIISNRPYEKIEDLVTKKAVGNAVFEKIKDKISVY